ncbi:MAG: MFS transporter [Bdellovibrionales bacterium]|nr:MFS transporter [Bdellovibrionales bacterium]
MNVLKRNLILFCFGQFGIMLLTRYLFQWLYAFGALKEESSEAVLLASATLAAFFLGFRVFDAVTDPMAGWLTAEVVRRRGSKLGLTKWVAWLAPLGLVFCFLPSFDFPPLMRWVSVLSGLTLFFVGYTLYAIPFWSLLDDLAEGNEEVKIRFSNALGIGLLLATALGFVAVPPLVHSIGYLYSALMIASVSLICMLLPQQMRLDPLEDRSPEVPLRIGDLFKIRSDIRFLALLCLLAGTQMAFTIITAAAPFFAIHLLQGDEADVAYLLGPLLLVALAFLKFVPQIAFQFGSLHSIKFGVLYLALVCGLIGWIGFPRSPSVFYTASFFCCAGPALALLLGLEGDLVSSAATHGSLPLSIYFGFFNFWIKFCNGIAFAGTGMLLGEFIRTEAHTYLYATIYLAAGIPLIGLGLYYLLSWIAGRSSASSTNV